MLVDASLEHACGLVLEFEGNGLIDIELELRIGHHVVRHHYLLLWVVDGLLGERSCVHLLNLILSHFVRHRQPDMEAINRWITFPSLLDMVVLSIGLWGIDMTLVGLMHVLVVDGLPFLNDLVLVLFVG